MIIPISWLNDYVDVPDDTQDLMERLTAIGHMQDGPAQSVTVPGDENGENNDDHQTNQDSHYSETVYDLEVRQNRPDCLSLLGIARETAAAYGLQVKWPPAYFSELPDLPVVTEVEIKSNQLCHRFEVLTFDNVQIKTSPCWLKNKLISYGVKPINIVVDITNYVMIEIGQPLHAFDAQQITDQKLIVRPAQNQEKVVVLGGKEISLTNDDLVIADHQKILALAGVIGGESSRVQSHTTQVIIEAANYNQASIRRSAIRHLLRTEASSRLEKFLHPQLTTMALRRVKQLLEDLTGAQLIGHTDVYPQPVDDVTISVHPSEIKRLGGINISLDEVQKLLASEEIKSDIIASNTSGQSYENNKILAVKVPYFRTDLEQEADIIEEILRLYGYENIPSQPLTAAVPPDRQSPFHQIEEQLRDWFVALGYDEQITEPLTTEEQPKRTPIKLENSLTSEKSMLRTTLQPNLMQVCNHRRKYRQQNIKLFEVGRIYFQEANENHEQHVVGALASAPNLTFLQIKGEVEAILAQLNYAYNNIFVSISVVDDRQPTFYIEINIDRLLAAQQQKPSILTAPPQLVLQDFSLLAPAKLPVGQILELIKQINPLVYKVKLGELPQSNDNETKSVFINVSYHDPQRTLSTQDVEPVRENIIKQLQKLGVVPKNS